MATPRTDKIYGYLKSSGAYVWFRFAIDDLGAYQFLFQTGTSAPDQTTVNNLVYFQNVLNYPGATNNTGSVIDPALIATVTFPDGSAAAPSITFTNEPTTGFYRAGAGVIGVTILGVQKFALSANGVQTADGGINTPAYSFLNSTSTGLFSSGAGSLDVSAGASWITSWTTAGLTMKSLPVIGVYNGINVTSTDGLILANGANAALGAQQISPRVRLTGAGWSTGASASQTCDWIIQNLPLQAATTGGVLQFQHSLGGAAYVTYMSIDASVTGQIKMISPVTNTGVIVIQNTSVSGFTQFDAHDNADVSKVLFGYGNASAGSFASTGYVLTRSGVNLDFGTDSLQRMRLCTSNGNLLLGSLTTNGTGFLQFPAGTTSAGGIAFGADTFLFRTGAGALRMSATTSPAFSITDGSVTGFFDINSGATTFRVGTNTTNAIQFIQNGGIAATIDTGKNAIFVGTVKAAGFIGSSGGVGLTQASTATLGRSITLENGLVTAFA